MTSPRGTLGRLMWPVYVPSFTYAAGVSALLPAQVLLALHLGFSAAGVALLATVVGGFGVVASLAAGSLVQRCGESRALLLATAPGVGLAFATWATVVAGRGAGAGDGTQAARALLVATVLAFDLADAVWGIARQGLVADLAAPEHRGRAMNVYGASQRLGRVAGPFVAAAVLAVLGPEYVFPVTAAIVVGAYGVMTHHLPGKGPDAPGATPPPGPGEAGPAAGTPRRGVLALALGIVAIAAVRTAKETLMPLWGADGLGLPPATVALVVGVSSLAELVLFWPAGVALDRLGRGPVAATCLALMGIGLAIMTASTDPVWFVATALLVGLGDGVGAGIVKTIGIDLAPDVGRGRFLGRWQAVSSAGSFAAPALAGAVIAHASLAAALPTVGAIGLVGAAWMGWWTPRILGSPRRRATPTAGGSPGRSRQA
ncbi:MFS transporter [Mobilicoccus pelagius]|uniref:Putative major facilitator superfamily transporter n=1 Tax=Mobilicoccus pelagius NBRC 104925 TaxID=1089455 RepID=H5UT18_9MICO|nr:MFS transporter [Mobilicoccus pelagius]GAB48876.1 putative major facilitator superfamily transporter [Mobilicoccus pelagius NBRC 104925]